MQNKQNNSNQGGKPDRNAQIMAELRKIFLHEEDIALFGEGLQSISANYLIMASRLERDVNIDVGNFIAYCLSINTLLNDLQWYDNDDPLPDIGPDTYSN